MVNGQGQTIGLWTNVVFLLSFDPSACKLPNLIQWMPLGSKCCLFIFRSQGQTADLCTNVGCSIFYSLLCLKVVKLGTVDAPKVDDPYWFSGHIDKGQGHTASCPLNISWWLCIKISKLVTVGAYRVDVPYWFSRSNCWFLKKCCPLNV